MSSIGFLTSAGERRVSGREHGKLHILVKELGWQAARDACRLDEPAGVDLLRRAVMWPDYVTAEPDFRTFVDRARTHTRVEGWNTRAVSPTCPAALNLTELGLNSVVAEYGNVITLACRIVSQCEVNAWVAGEDRAWLADLIEAGLATPYPPAGFHEGWPPAPTTVFSDGDHWRSHYDGWAAVVDMLRADDRGIVVLDYSVTDGFPDMRWAAWPGVAGARMRKEWNAAGPEVHWRWSERGLQRRTRQERALLQISPANLHDPTFGIHEAWTWQALADAWRAHDLIPV